MSNNIAVKVTADVAEIQAKFAIARAEVAGLSAEMNKLARASVNGGLDATASARLQQVSSDFVHAKTTASGLAEQLKGVKESSAGLGGALEEVRSGISKAFAVSGIAVAGEAVMKVGEAISTLGERAIEIRSMSSVLGVTTSQFQAMQVASEEAGVGAEVFARAGEKLTNILTEAREGSGKAIEKLHALGISTADIANPTFQLNNVLAVLKERLEDTSTAEQTRKALLQELGSRTALAIQAIQEYDGTLKGVEAAMARINGLSSEQIDRLAQSKTWWSELGTSISNTTSKLFTYVTEAHKMASFKLGGGGSAEQSGGGSVRGTIDRSGASEEQQAAQESARAQETARAEALHDEMEKIKEGVAAFASGTAERLSALRQYAADAKQYYGSANNVDEVRRANSEVLAAEREYRATQSREAIGDAKEQVQALTANTSLGLAQRLDAERQIWSKILSNDQITGAQRLEAAREFSREYTEIAKQTAAQTAAIARQDVAADISISRMKVEAAKQAADTSVTLDQNAATRKLATLRDLTNQEFSLNESALQNELRGLNAETPAYNAVYNQIRQLKARLVLDLGKLDKDYEETLKRLTKEEATSWRSAVNEIESAEGTFVSDMLGRRKSLSQSILSIGQDLISREIANDLRAVTTRLLLQRSADAQEKALQQGGFIYHQAIELQKAAATAHAQTAQTSATTAGNTARETATASAAAAGQAEAAATGPATVMADAAKAFSGTFAAIAQIPYVGPYIAPEAAAASYATVAAFAPQAALATGTNYVPEDMTARIHKGEAVIPKKYNPAAGGSGGGDTHHHHWNVNAVDATSFAAMLSNPAHISAITSAVSRHVSRGGRI